MICGFLAKWISIDERIKKINNILYAYIAKNKVKFYNYNIISIILLLQISMNLKNMVYTMSREISNNEDNIKNNNTSNTSNEDKKIIKNHSPKNKYKHFLPNKEIKSIPKNIFQTWHSKNLPKSMANNVIHIKKCNPEFKHYLFDDEDCRNFIKNNFDSKILFAYDNLIPGAYKADLWRYCVLYIKGGIYLDIKYIPENEFKFMNLIDKEHWTLDNDNDGIYNAFMINYSGNSILLKAINQIVQNVNNKFYGSSSLYPTGPKLLIQFFSNKEKENFDLKHYAYENNTLKIIVHKGCVILKLDLNYCSEYRKFSKQKHYSELWDDHNIYYLDKE